MKVAIDIRRVLDFGTGTYTRNLLTTLARIDRDTSYVLLGTAADWAELGSLPENFFHVVFDRSRHGLRHDLHLGWLLRRHRIDVFHSPYLESPWVLPCRHVITVHDTVEFLDVPRDGYSLADLVHFHRTRHSLRRARCVLSVSQATRRDLQRIFGVPGEKIRVIYNALDTRLEQAPTIEEVERTLGRYSVQIPYLLYTGNVKPHKNLPRLIEAFALVKDELRDHPQYANLKLIIIGDELSRHPQLRRAVINSRVQQDVRFLGFVAPQTLSVFYARAAAFVFPSLYEGFGLPPLEAMAQGTPVITSNVTALPEVLGDAALFVNPENVFEISRGIRQVLMEENLRRELSERGRQQVRRFSWEESARRVLEAYREAARL